MTMGIAIATITAATDAHAVSDSGVIAILVVQIPVQSGWNLVSTSNPVPSDVTITFPFVAVE